MKNVIALAVLLTACPSSRPTAFVPVTAGGEVLEAGESSVVVLTRPGADGVLVQLWIDAGAIDAADEHGAPELASLAAWIAEARAGAEVHARVVPDGTMLETHASSLDDAVARLALALRTRDPTDGELAAAREVLRARRRGRARDPLAALEAHAVSLVLGPADPLGLEPEADHDEVALASVRSFLAAHYGPTRGRWIAVGNLEPSELRGAVLAATGASPTAEHEAAPRRLRTDGERTVAREDDAGFAVAYLSPDPSGLGGALGLATGPGDRYAHFQTPCGELGLSSGVGSLDEARLRQLAFALAAGTALRGDVSSDASADAERAGLSFVARRERCASAPESGLRAVVIAAPDHPERRLPDVEAVLGSARTIALSHVDVDGHSALFSLTLSGGSLEDPASAHGRAAILARALAGRCGVRAAIRPEAIVLEGAIEGTSAEARDTSLAEALRCLLVEPVPTAFVETARAEVLSSLDPAALFLARAAETLAPGTPGLVAPLGSPAGLASAAELTEALASLRATRRLALSVVSPSVPSESIGLALGALASGESYEPVVGEPGPTEIFLASVESATVEILLTLRVDVAPGGADADARTVATLLATELDATPLAVSRFASGASAGVSWMAIGVSGPDEAIDAVARHFEGAVARAELRLDAALAEAELQRQSDASERSTRASEVVRRMGAAERALDPLASRTLLHASPHRVVIRPDTPPIRRR